MTAHPVEVPDDVAAAERELRQGLLRPARERLLAALPALERGDAAVYRRAVNMLGAAHFELGELAEASAAFARALELANHAGDALVLGRACNNLGMIANVTGRREEALTQYQLAIPAYQRVGSTAGLAETCHNLAITYRDLGQYDPADRYERRAIGYAREAGNQRLLAMAHVGRGDLSLRRGEAAVAEAGARLGAEQYAAIPDHLGEADALRLAGAARTALGQFAAARTALDRAVSLAREHASPLIEAEALEARARLAARERRWAEAGADVAVALGLLERLGAAEEHAALARWYGEARAGA